MKPFKPGCLNTWNLQPHLVCVLFGVDAVSVFALNRCAFSFFSPSQPRRAEAASLAFLNVLSPSHLSEHHSSLGPAVTSQQRLARARRAHRTSACSVCSRVTHPKPLPTGRTVPLCQFLTYENKFHLPATVNAVVKLSTPSS